MENQRETELNFWYDVNDFHAYRLSVWMTYVQAEKASCVSILDEDSPPTHIIR